MIQRLVLVFTLLAIVLLLGSDTVHAQSAAAQYSLENGYTLEVETVKHSAVNQSHALHLRKAGQDNKTRIVASALVKVANVSVTKDQAFKSDSHTRWWVMIGEQFGRATPCEILLPILPDALPLIACHDVML